MKYLVTGGVRSGKSFHAETLVVAEPSVTYIAPGPHSDDDPDWVSRVSAHRERRPGHWRTVETMDLEKAIAMADGAVIVDCLGTWVSALIDELNGWDKTLEEWEPVFLDRLDVAAAAVTAHTSPVVLVTNEVGLGVVPEHRSGRLFRDFLGRVNQRFALEVDEVILVIAGRTLTL